MDSLSKNKQKKRLKNPHKSFDPSLKREHWRQGLRRLVPLCRGLWELNPKCQDRH